MNNIIGVPRSGKAAILDHSIAGFQQHVRSLLLQKKKTFPFSIHLFPQAFKQGEYVNSMRFSLSRNWLSILMTVSPFFFLNLKSAWLTALDVYSWNYVGGLLYKRLWPLFPQWVLPHSDVQQNRRNKFHLP